MPTPCWRQWRHSSRLPSGSPHHPALSADGERDMGGVRFEAGENVVRRLRPREWLRSFVGDGQVLYDGAFELPPVGVDLPAELWVSVSARDGLALMARGCSTSIAHPTLRPSPSQLGHPVRAVTRRPCAS